jgi:hypothetical protein
MVQWYDTNKLLIEKNINCLKQNQLLTSIQQQFSCTDSESTVDLMSQLFHSLTNEQKLKFKTSIGNRK